MKKNILFLLIIFSLCAISGNADINWGSDTFGGEATVTEPGVNWYSDTFGGEAIISGWSDWSPWWVMRMIMTYPPTLGTPDPVNGSIDRAFSFTWSILINDSDGHLFDWSIECDNGQSNSSSDDSNGTKNLSLTGLSANTLYTIYVNTSDDYDSTANWFIFTTLGNSPPTSFSSSVYNTTAINLTWTKDIDAQTTRIVRKKGSVPGSFPDGGTIVYNGTGELFNDTFLDIGTLYGYGAWSWNENNSATFVTTSCYTNPGDPSALTNISLGAYNVLLEWTKGTNATHTLIIVNSTGSADYPTTPYDGVEEYNGTGTQGTILGLYPNITYYFSAFGYIDALDGYFSEGYSTHNCTTLLSTDEPSGLTAEPYNHTLITLTWSGGAYPIAIFQKAGSYPSNQTDGEEIYNGTGLTTQDTGLLPTIDYYYSGWAWTGVGYGVNVTQDHSYTRPMVPTSDTSYDLDTNLTISWDPFFVYLTDDFEGNLSLWTENGWELDTDQKANGSYSIKGMDNDGDLISPEFNTTGADNINISFWYRDDDCEANDMNLMFWNGTAGVDIFDLCSSGDDTWYYFAYNTTDADYHIDDFYFYFDESLDATTENIWVDDISLSYSNDDETYIIRKSSSGWVSAVDEGTSVYSGSGLSVVDPYITSMVYYSIWSYSSLSTLYSQQYNITWGGLAINCHNESNASQNLTFDLFVTNVNGSDTYIAYDLSNTYYIDVADLPTGNKTVVQIGSDGYKTRYYYMDLFPNAFYILDSYLPLAEPPGGGGGGNETYADLYLFTVENFYSDPVDDAMVTIQRYIPEDDEYKPVTILYTDATGQCSLYLLPENIYKIQIEASGYETEIVDFTADPEIRVHTFRLDWIDITDDADTEGILDGISFTILPSGHYHTGNFTIYYNITSSESQLEWFRAIFYEWNSSALTWDQLYSENNTASASGGSIDYFVENNTGKYKMDAYFKKENFSEYEVIQAGSTIWFLSWGGLATSGLTEGIPDFVYLLVIVILCAIAMAFFMPMAGLGTGYIGIGIMAFGLILKPDLMLSDGSTGWMILAITTLVYTLALFLWSRL